MRSDLELLRAWQLGDKGGGEALVARHFASLHWFFRNKAGAGVEDLVQATFLACVEAQPRLVADTNFRAYMFKVARNILADYFLEQGRAAGTQLEQEASAATLGGSPPSILVARQEQRVLLAGLRSIPLVHQTLLELYYWEGLSGVELASAMEIPEGTVRSRLRRARELLRDAIGRMEAAPELVHTTLTGLDTWARSVRSNSADSGES